MHTLYIMQRGSIETMLEGQHRDDAGGNTLERRAGERWIPCVARAQWQAARSSARTCCWSAHAPEQHRIWPWPCPANPEPPCRPFQEEGEVSGPPWKHQPQRLLRSDLSAPSAFGQGLVAIMFGPHYKNRLGESSQGVAEGEVRQLALMSAGVIVERDGLLELFD